MSRRWLPQPAPRARALREANRRVVEAERAIALARLTGDGEALADAHAALEAAQAAHARLNGGAR